MREKIKVIFAWVLFAFITVALTAGMIFYFSVSPTGIAPTIFQILFAGAPVVFAFIGALIISRQPRNVIGLLMMIPGLALTIVTDAYLQPYISGQIPPPTSPTNLDLLVFWFSSWNWLLLILPLMFIMVLFPTGRTISPGWNWLVYFGIGIVAIFVFLATFSNQLTPGSGDVAWTVPNPIGFLELSWSETIVGPLLLFFPIWIVLCALSLFVRFRKAQAVEREQIKWLFFAGLVFVLFYAPTFIGNTYSQAENLWNILLPIGMLAFPVAIAIAILRYRLYDIDIIIRRTLQYTLVTGLLALVYFGSVLILQDLVERFTGERSPVVIVISTLTIAALFNPLRNRIQEFIDRRFFRKKYDAERALADFAATARDEVDMEQLNTALLRVVDDAMQPERVSLWVVRKGS